MANIYCIICGNFKIDTIQEQKQKQREQEKVKSLAPCQLMGTFVFKMKIKWSEVGLEYKPGKPQGSRIKEIFEMLPLQQCQMSILFVKSDIHYPVYTLTNG